MSTNPFRHHTNQLFANRGCDIDAALAYANEVITAMPTEQHAHAMTALMVVVNTAANAFDQARGPSPEKLAILDLIRNEIDNWASSHLDDRIESWHGDNVDIDNTVNEWMNEYLESHISDAIDNLDLVVRTR